MFLMYVDESGDSGLINSPTRYFILSGLVTHELRWQATLNQLVEFRRRMRVTYGLKLREEIHAIRMLNRRPGELARIPKYNRLAIVRNLLSEIAQLPDMNIVSVVVDKQGKSAGYDVFENAWRALIQRFDNTISYRNFPGPANADERGLIFSDQTDGTKLLHLLRRMRRYNPVPHMRGVTAGPGYRQLVLQKVIGDPIFQNSAQSYFVQAADVVAYALQQQFAPNSYMREKSGKNFYRILDPVLCKKASTTDPQGIVRL